jgi:hypothetical protein
MNKTSISKISRAGFFVLLLCAAGSLYGQTLTLSINPTSISFSAADPDITPQITANRTVRVTIRITSGGGRPWQLTLQANGNLSDSSTTASIDISNISWTATSSPPFQAGTLAANIAQIGASGTGNVNRSADLTFVFQNLWTYWAGSYTQTVTFTLARL